MRRLLLAILALVAGLAPLRTTAQDLCADLFRQGYDDENLTLTSQQNFQYLQTTFCSDNAETYAQATSDGFNLGVKVLDLVDATLGGKTDESSYTSRRTQFCSYKLDTATAGAPVLGAIKTASTAATAAVKQCFDLHPAFSITITPKDTLDGFAVTLRDNSGDANVIAISADTGALKCDKAVPAKVTPPFTFNCTKPQEKTLLVSVQSDKGSVSGVEVYGTDRTIPDMQNAIAALTQAAQAGSTPTAATSPAPATSAAAPFSCLGCIVASVLAEKDFQQANGDGWALCQGQSIAGSKLADATGAKTVPDLRGVFLRGRNDGRFPTTGKTAVAEHELGAYTPDSVGPHQHKIMVPGEESQPAGADISSTISPHAAVEESSLVRSYDGATETQPKNVTVNYYCKIN